jgi:hypothetical protein
VIVVHGSSRNATSSFSSVEEAMGATERQDVLVVAPQFLISLDVEGQDPLPDLVVWRSGIWSQGDRSFAEGQAGRPSSFEVLDAIVEALSTAPRKWVSG